MLCPRQMGCPPPARSRGGGWCTAPAARGGGQVKWGGHHRQGGAPHPLHARHGGHTGDPPHPAVAGVPCPPLPCAPPPSPCGYHRPGVGTPHYSTLYSVPLQALFWRWWGAMAAVTTPLELHRRRGGGVLHPSNACPRLRGLKQVQKWPKKQPFS